MRSFLVSLAVAAVTLAGCSKQQPPVVTATPDQPTQTTPGGATVTPPPPPPSTDPNACTNAIAAGVSELSRMIHFDTDMFDLQSQDMAILDAKADLLRLFPAVRLRITGHADERYTDEYNLVLGTRRAEAARDYLTRKGVEGGRLETASLGETAPLDPGHDEGAWSRNRRDEFTLLAGRETLSSRVSGCR